eukprot:g892.t1
MMTTKQKKKSDEMRFVFVVLLLALFGRSDATVYNFETDGGAKANDRSWDTVWNNGRALNASLAKLSSGDTFIVPEGKVFYLMGGIKASNLTDVVLHIDGTLEFASTLLDDNDLKYVDAWPRNGDGKDAPVLECIYMENLNNVTFTSSGSGMLDGAGGKWWGIPGVGYLVRTENRPRLLHISNGKDIVIEHLYFKDSPYWTFLADSISNLVVRYSKISARRDSLDEHSYIDLSAFNTDGFDLSGCDGVHVHDCDVWNQDDSFDVKDGTRNVLIERVNSSGLGLTIGSISSHVANITFRDAYMHKTYKGVYMKFRGPGLVENVLYENIVMDEPEQFAIWIGPAQQCDGCDLKDICKSDPCSLCWPTMGECRGPTGALYKNITLRNITINSPKKSPGVLIASATDPMQHIVFDDVVVNNPGSKPFDGYHCENVQGGVALGKTSPVPSCFEDRTTERGSASA